MTAGGDSRLKTEDGIGILDDLRACQKLTAEFF